MSSSILGAANDNRFIFFDNSSVPYSAMLINTSSQSDQLPPIPSQGLFSTSVTKLELQKNKGKLERTECGRKTCFCVVSSVCHPITCIPFLILCGSCAYYSNVKEPYISPSTNSELCVRAICPWSFCEKEDSSCFTCVPDTDFLHPPEREEMNVINSKLAEIYNQEIRNKSKASYSK